LVYGGIYYDPDIPAIVPDGFLSLGVERIVDEELRLSYVLWEENNVVPQFVLEVVSQKYRGEYSKKKALYAELGVLYYAVYSSRRRRKPRLEVYQLVNGEYVTLSGNPIWLPELGLGIGYERGKYLGITRECLYWYDEQSDRYLTPEEIILESEQQILQAEQQILQTKQQLDRERQRSEKLAERLRELNIDPDNL
jgi:Putative restriction endonuclease